MDILASRNVLVRRRKGEDYHIEPSQKVHLSVSIPCKKGYGWVGWWSDLVVFPSKVYDQHSDRISCTNWSPFFIERPRHVIWRRCRNRNVCERVRPVHAQLTPAVEGVEVVQGWQSVCIQRTTSAGACRFICPCRTQVWCRCWRCSRVSHTVWPACINKCSNKFGQYVEK